jgi:hypothetical protein
MTPTIRLKKRTAVCKFGPPKFDGSCPLKEFFDMSNKYIFLGNLGTEPTK